MSSFADSASQAGQGIAGFLSPIIGGKSSTTTTTSPGVSPGMIFGAIAVIGLVLYFTLSKSST